MDTAPTPTLTFVSGVASRLRRSNCNWSADVSTSAATYNVSDANVDTANVAIDVTGAKDAHGNDQTDYTPSTNFTADTLNPSDVIFSLLLLLITDSVVGTCTFRVDVLFAPAMDPAATPTLTFAPFFF